MYKTALTVKDQEVVSLVIAPKDKQLSKYDVEVSQDLYENARIAMESGFHSVKWVNNKLEIEIVYDLFKEDTRNFILDLRRQPVSVLYEGTKVTTLDNCGSYGQHTEYVDAFSDEPLIFTATQKEELAVLFEAEKASMLKATSAIVVELEKEIPIDRITEIRSEVLCLF